MASENARVRDLYRLYQPWSERHVAPRHISSWPATSPRSDHYKPQSSTDTALTAFAQLGCLRLNVKRCLVTLIAASQQYILAEATRTLSLIRDNDHEALDELWFGNAVLPRTQGISENALWPEPYTAQGTDNAVYTTPAFVVNDITEDDRFKHKRYAGRGIKFYAGVPIITRTGNAIGVYTVTDDNARAGLTHDELKFMRDMATVVLTHLESVKNETARDRGERLVRGLGSFIEGRSSYASHSSNNDRETGSPTLPESITSFDQTAEEENSAVVREFKGMTISDVSRTLDFSTAPLQQSPRMETEQRTSTGHRISGPSHDEEDVEHPPGSILPDDNDTAGAGVDDTQPHPCIPHVTAGAVAREQHSSDYKRTFHRAADILRDAMGADGVMFFDASSANLGRGLKTTTVEGNIQTSLERGSSTSLASESSDDSIPRRSARPLRLNSDYSSSSSRRSSSDDGQPASTAKSDGRCDILGLSMKPSKSIQQAANAPAHLWIREQDLRSCIKRYPAGRVFLFTQDGDLSSSDSDLPSQSPANPRSNRTTRGSARARHSHRSIAMALRRVLPEARNIVFLPLWEFARDRWSAGAFIWSTEPQRLLNAQDDLSYIKSFGNSIMNEISRLHIASADQAKASFLANISHELRSPLHGILGSVEFLHDTAVDAFQSGLITSVETCGKTLLDTVEHVLDYAKINQLSRKSAMKLGSSHDKESSKSSQATHTLVEDFDLAVIIEEVVEAVFAGQTFRSTHADFSANKKPQSSPVTESRSLSGSRGEVRKQIVRGSAHYGNDVNLTLDIDHDVDWHVLSQPGAIRRITMNLLGNALKYTEKGAVCVSLRLGSPKDRISPLSSPLSVCLTISDTGRGMSEDFLRNHVFTPFTQEDSFANGTGLGLSIVQQIVTSLSGKIDLKSQKNVGTEVKVWLNLPKGQQKWSDAESTGLLASVQKETPGWALCLLEPEDSHSGVTPVGLSSSKMLSLNTSIRTLANGWFGMSVFSSPTMKNVQADFFIYAEPPSIEYLLHEHGDKVGRKEVPVILMCTNAYESASLRANGIHRLTDIGRVIEVISQPCGPQKLARALHRCLRRIEKVQAPDCEPSGPTSVAVCDNPSVSESKAHLEEGGAPETDSETNETEEQESNVTKPEGEDDKAPSDTVESEAEMDAGRGRDAEQRWPSQASNSPNDQPKQLQAFRATRRFPSASEAGTTVFSNRIDPPPMTRRVTESSSSPSASRAAPAHKEPNSRPPRVLLVDDNPINLQLLVTFMRKTGTRHASASDGLQALNLYKQALSDAIEEPFSHVLMDISMPVMDGLESTREIRKFERERERTTKETNKDERGERRRSFKNRVVIHALTGLGSEAVQRDAERSGMDGFLAKPIRLSMLKDLLGIE